VPASIVVLLISVSFLPNAFGAGNDQQDVASVQTFYVAPHGSDSNPGTEKAPWKSMFKATGTLKAGETAVFEDGVYEETQEATFANSGTASAPITVKARNKHKAMIRYVGRSNENKITARAKTYITIQDFEITQDQRGGPGNVLYDTPVICWQGSDYCRVIGNKIHKSAGACVRTTFTRGTRVDGNICFDVQGWGAVSTFGTTDLVIANNEIYGTVGTEIIYSKGGAKGTRVYNNHIRTSGDWITAILLGGSSGAQWVEDKNGYEGYNQVAFNNIIVADSPGGIHQGILIRGCDNCAAFNNVVVGAQYGLVASKGSGKEKGWNWEVTSRNPRFMNNIVMGCTQSATSFNDIDGTVVHDYNLYHRCAGAPTQQHGVQGDPLFVDATSDWRLRVGSPAIDAGSSLAFKSTSGETIDLSKDRVGATRAARWDIGAYEHGSTAPDPVVPVKPPAEEAAESVTTTTTTTTAKTSVVVATEKPATLDVKRRTAPSATNPTIAPANNAQVRAPNTSDAVRTSVVPAEVRSQSTAFSSTPVASVSEPTTLAETGFEVGLYASTASLSIALGLTLLCASQSGVPPLDRTHC